MKAIRNILAGLTIALFVLSGSVFAHQADSSILSEPTFALPAEQYVNDIPFNTAKIAADAQYQKALHATFSVPEEEYVNDIPFDTHKIAMDYLYEKAMAQVFTIPEEKYVNDIPFSTKKVVLQMKINRQLLTNR